MWTSVTSPSGEVTTRAERMPSRLVSRFSARLTPQGSGIASTAPLVRGGCPCIGGRPTFTGPLGLGLNPVTSYPSSRSYRSWAKGVAHAAIAHATTFRPAAFAR